MEKPGRPLGLSLAIIFSLMLYSLLPLAQAAFILSLRQQFAATEFLDGGSVIGGALEGIDETRLVISVVMSLIFFAIALMTWRGKPKKIRYIFISAVIAITAITIGWTFASLGQQATLEQGIDSAGALADSLLVFQMIVSGLIALYVIWYVNRGPARAFFRGYYLPEPEETPA